MRHWKVFPSVIRPCERSVILSFPWSASLTSIVSFYSTPSLERLARSSGRLDAGVCFTTPPVDDKDKQVVGKDVELYPSRKEDD